ARRRPPARRAERPLPGRPLRVAVPAAGLALRQPGRLHRLADRGRVALRLRAQPDGDDRHRLPLVDRGRDAAGRRGGRVGRCRRGRPARRLPLLPPRRALVRGRDLMAGSAIQVRGVSKRYRLGAGPYLTLRESLAGLVRRGRGDPGGEVWALRDVDLDVDGGEGLGVVGLNGAGKSTLLRILARITEPTAGLSRTRGRVGALLEVGTGFHPELTGRENVYLNGAILGMKRREIQRRFEEIVAF